MRSRLLKIIIMLGAIRPGSLMSQVPPQNLAGASLEDLLNIEVTSVSKKEQALSKTGAAVFVINQEDIRRSGALNIPDLLRMAPGVDVAQIDSNQWAVSIRGFNAVYSNKVLVLIDGRTVYVNSFSGVFWDQVNVPLNDIERIEVIRGPGGTVWGANAVNGVINIITKSSADTKGGFVEIGGGTQDKATAFVQYGGNAGSTGAYRVFGRYSNIASSVFPGGLRAGDGWHSSQSGFRSDWSPSSQDTVSVQGDFQSSQGGETETVVATAPLAQFLVNRLVPNTSGDVLGRWVHSLANGSETSFQIYDNVMRRQALGIDVANNTLDLDFEHHLAIGSRHDIVWGFDYRIAHDSLVAGSNPALRVTPADKTDNLYAAFFQDEIRVGKSLFLTLGSKFEHNAYSGFEFEPSAQLVWTASNRHSFWAAAAHAIRQPAHVEYGTEFNEAIVPVPGVGDALVTLYGNPHLQAERLNDYEVGYRGQVTGRLSFDFTAFASYYNGLETLEPQSPFFVESVGRPLLVLPQTWLNLGHARDYGVELFANWSINRRWRISPGYSLLNMTTGVAPTSKDTEMVTVSGASPKYQPQVRSMVNLRRNLEWDSSLKYVSMLPTKQLPGYARIDTRLGWRLGESVEMSVTGQNLGSPRHVEFVDVSGLLSTEVARSLFGKITWRF